MDIPSTLAGIVEQVSVKVGDKVSQGDVVLVLSCQQNETKCHDVLVEKEVSKKQEVTADISFVREQDKVSPVKQKSTAPLNTNVYASPSVRRLAREFGVDLTLVEGRGRKSRILKEDVQTFVKGRLSEPQANAGIPQIASVDFSKFGQIELQPLNKIKRLTAQNMSRSWLNVPHVTHFDEADITELEYFRKSNKEKALAQGIKLTPLAFIVQAIVKALQAFPTFNASLDAKGENLVLKQYYNVGIAVDTPNGLVVPVIKNAETKGLLALAKEMAELGQNARKKALTPADMAGGCFTISSLGGIGGSGFTPIVNAPEVAILGVSKSQMKPVFNGKDFDPRLMLPLSLSYDHRVIDGAEAARFSAFLSQSLSDIRTLLL
jgi:pyruvate dehydrogenase E2 component (dihydrolipoamide acetyltransferase)